MYLKNKTLSTVSSTMLAVFLMEKSAIDTKSSGKKRQVIEFVDWFVGTNTSRAR